MRSIATFRLGSSASVYTSRGDSDPGVTEDAHGIAGRDAQGLEQGRGCVGRSPCSRIRRSPAPLAMRWKDRARFCGSIRYPELVVNTSLCRDQLRCGPPMTCIAECACSASRAIPNNGSSAAARRSLDWAELEHAASADRAAGGYAEWHCRIHLGPSQAQDSAAAQPVDQHQDERRIQRVASGTREEPPRLISTPRLLAGRDSRRQGSRTGRRSLPPGLPRMALVSAAARAARIAWTLASESPARTRPFKYS